MVREGLTEKVESDRVVKFKFENVGKLPPPVLQVRAVGACVRFGGRRLGVRGWCMLPPAAGCRQPGQPRWGAARLWGAGWAGPGQGPALLCARPSCTAHGLGGTRLVGASAGCTQRRRRSRILMLALVLPPPCYLKQFTDVTFGYSPDKVLYSHVDLGADLDSRVAIVSRLLP